MWTHLYCAHPSLGFPKMRNNILFCSTHLLYASFGSVVLSIVLWISLESTEHMLVNVNIPQMCLGELTLCNDSPGQRKPQNDLNSPSWVGQSSPVSLLESPGSEVPYWRVISAYWKRLWWTFSIAKLKSHCLNDIKSHFDEQITPVSRPNWSNKTKVRRPYNSACTSGLSAPAVPLLGGCHGDSPVGGGNSRCC